MSCEPVSAIRIIKVLRKLKLTEIKVNLPARVQRGKSQGLGQTRKDPVTFFLVLTKRKMMDLALKIIRHIFAKKRWNLTHLSEVFQNEASQLQLIEKQTTSSTYKKYLQPHQHDIQVCLQLNKAEEQGCFTVKEDEDDAPQWSTMAELYFQGLYTVPNVQSNREGSRDQEVALRIDIK